YTWRESDNYVYVSLPGSKSGLQEPGVLELYENCLWQWFRTDLGCQYQSFSYDNGKTWSVPVPSMFSGPQSPMSVKRIKDRDLLAVYNPVPAYNGRRDKSGWDRTPLVCTIFRDNDLRPQKLHVLEDNNSAGYCYIAIHFTEDAALFGYSVSGEYPNGLGLRVKRIPLSELYS
ncbi:MAG: exo-alpha-sialidase, partial [Clostridiaceae bacterium]|nr:exo-alpha-sialidase [Clostridiaceae bacterium]